MRFTVPFAVQQIPLSYRMMLVSIIKDSLRLADEDYYTQLYEARKNEMKPFSTAVYLRNINIEEDNILLDELLMTISSPDQELMLHLYNGLLKNKRFQYRDTYLERGKIRFVKEHEIRSSKVLFRTLSPMLIENKEGKPISPDSTEYAQEINYYADLVLKSYQGKGLVKQLKVTPVAMQKQVIQESNQEFESQRSGAGNGKQKLYFTAYKGLLELVGDPRDLQLIYQLGLSKRRGQNFGCLEVIREEV